MLFLCIIVSAKLARDYANSIVRKRCDILLTKYHAYTDTDVPLSLSLSFLPLLSCFRFRYLFSHDGIGYLRLRAIIFDYIVGIEIKRRKIKVIVGTVSAISDTRRSHIYTIYIIIQ